MGSELSLGVDLGGTKIYAIVTDSSRKALADAKTVTEAGADPGKVAEQILRTSEEAMAKLGLKPKDAAHIGVAVPSSVDPVTGDCHFAPNLGWKKFSMKELFKRLFGKEVFIGNDGNLGILGEFNCGAAQGCKSAIGYFVGTGLGGGVIIDGKLLVGNCGLAGELGHTIVKYGGRKCGCGNRGCIEAYCSKIAFVKAIKKEIFSHGAKSCLVSDKFDWSSKNIKSRFLAKAYSQSDAVVKGVVDKGFRMLGAAAAGVCVTVAPECVILGGGVVETMGNEVLPVFKKGFEKHLFGFDPAKIQIKLSSLGDSAVAMGATILAQRKGAV